MPSQTFKVTATPRARFQLAQLLFRRELTFKERKPARELRRAREALGLVEMSIQLIDHQRVGELWKDDTTRNIFEVTEENAEFVLATLEKLEKSTAELFLLEPLLQQLEDKKDATDLEGALPFDAAAEKEGWKPDLLSPHIERPAQMVDVLREALKAESYGQFREVLLDAFSTGDEPKAPRGVGVKETEARASA